MRRIVSLYRSSVGKKVVMAASGLVLFLFIVGHMLGNLKAFEGPEAFNQYAEALRGVGTPIIPDGGALWLTRAVLLVAAVAHIGSAVQLWQQSQRARPVGYRREDSLVFSYASRTMRWGGVIILAFVVYHLLHLTFGTVHRDFQGGLVYENVVIAFQSWLVSGVYIVANAALALHLYHGLWSATQTLGAAHPKYERFRRPVALAISLIIFFGFVSVPLAVLGGVLTLAG